MSFRSYTLDVIKTPSTKGVWPWVFASPFLIALSEYLAVAPVGTDIFLGLVIMFYGLGAMVAILALLVLPFFLIKKTRRKPALAWLAISATLIPLVLTGLKIGRDIRLSAFDRLAERSTTLVTSINQFIDDQGAPPKSLDDLVPHYLSEVPKTGMMAYSEYKYEVATYAESYEGNPWILRVNTPSGGINFDQFMYFPLQNYPDNGYGGIFRRVGDWAYLHE